MAIIYDQINHLHFLFFSEINPEFVDLKVYQIWEYLFKDKSNISANAYFSMGPKQGHLQVRGLKA